MNCRATWTTVTTTDDVVATRRDPNFYPYWEDVIPDGVAVVRDGDRLLRLDVHDHYCLHPAGHAAAAHECADCDVIWTDDAKGAASHADNTPTKADVCCSECSHPKRGRCSNCLSRLSDCTPPDDEQECDTCAATGCRYPEEHDPPCECCDCDNGYVTPPADESITVHEWQVNIIARETGAEWERCYNAVVALLRAKPPANVCPDCGAQPEWQHDCPTCGDTGNAPKNIVEEWHNRIDKALSGTGDRPAVTDADIIGVVYDFTGVALSPEQARKMRAALEAVAAVQQEKA